MKTTAILCFFSSFFFFQVAGQNLPAKFPYPFDVKQIHSGHSLTDPLFHPHWPGQYVNLMNDVLGYWSGDLIGKSTVPGSPIQHRWENPPGYGAPDARHDITNWELLSITERVPLYYEGGSEQEWYLEGLENQRISLSQFVNNAWLNGNDSTGAPTLLWTTWTNIDNSDGPWREMLDIQGEEWENMQDYANDHLEENSTPVYLIPGHKLMARLYDDIQLGLVPDVDTIADFFSDNIHTNELGAYAIAMIHYACIFNRTPLGLPNNLLPGAPQGTPIPSPALAEYLQMMIWEVVTTYPRTGIYQSLSVDGVNIDAKLNNQTVVIQFSIDRNEKFSLVELQHSGKDQKYTTIYSFIPDLEPKPIYEYIHEYPNSGENYYRLQLTDANGEKSFSAIRSADVKAKFWTIYPNPAFNSLTIEGNTVHSLNVRVRDVQGRILKEDAGSSVIDISSFAPGIYLMEVRDGGRFQVEKVVIK